MTESITRARDRFDAALAEVFPMAEEVQAPPECTFTIGDDLGRAVFRLIVLVRGAEDGRTWLCVNGKRISGEASTDDGECMAVRSLVLALAGKRFVLEHGRYTPEGGVELMYALSGRSEQATAGAAQ